MGTSSVKVLFTLLLFLGILPYVKSQEAFLRLGGGYGIAASKDVFSLTHLERDSNNVYTLDENIYGTLGAGGQLHLSGGYFFKNNFGFALDASYLWGTRTYSGEKNTKLQNELYYAYTRQMRLSPSVIIKANPCHLFVPYVGSGVIIPLFGKTVVEEQFVNSARTTDKTTEVKGSFSLGFETYAGTTINIPSEDFSFFVEMRYTGLRIKSKDAKVVYWTQIDANGTVTDALETATVSSKEIVFVDRLDANSNTITATVFNMQFDSDQPIELLARKTNFNSLAFNIGVNMRFGANKKELIPENK